MPRKTKIDNVKSAQEVEITVTLVPTGQIDDNPYNFRKHYPEDEVRKMGESLQEFGLRQVPTGRRTKEGRVQVAFGHVRLRGYRWNEKNTGGEPGSAKDPRQWEVMPLILKDLTDEQMFDYAWEENLTRSEVSRLDVARAIDNYCRAFPNVLDKDIAKRHNMSEANVSNMRRVLRLPEIFLTKIEEGAMSFTQGRELLALEGFANAESLMSMALAQTIPNTVEALHKSIEAVLKARAEAELRTMVIEEKTEGVTVQVMSGERHAIKGLLGNLETSLPQLPALLVETMTEWGRKRGQTIGADETLRLALP